MRNGALMNVSGGVPFHLADCESPLMPLDFTNTIVPENNLRLPDALTIKYGPAELLARFVLAGDMAARRRGIQFRLMNMFNSEYAVDLSPENSYWISGQDEYGEIVLTQAGRVYHWPDTTLEDEARLMFFGGQDLGQ